MIIAHALIGLMPVVDKKFSWFWLVGSVIPDVDHLFSDLSTPDFFFKAAYRNGSA